MKEIRYPKLVAKKWKINFPRHFCAASSMPKSFYLLKSTKAKNNFMAQTLCLEKLA